MTVIYFKEDGKIVSVYSGDLQKIDTLYGEDAKKYKLIMAEIVIDDDIMVIRNPSDFKVNTETKQLEILPQAQINKYPVAFQ